MYIKVAMIYKVKKCKNEIITNNNKKKKEIQFFQKFKFWNFRTEKKKQYKKREKMGEKKGKNEEKWEKREKFKQKKRKKISKSREKFLKQFLFMHNAKTAENKIICKLPNLFIYKLINILFSKIWMNLS